MIPLNLCHLLLRINLDKLCVLIRSQNKEIFSLQNGVQIQIGFPNGRSLRRMQEGSQIGPEFPAGLIWIPHACKRSLKPIFFCKLPEITAKGRRILIVKIPASRGGQSRGSSNYNAVCFFYFFDQFLNLLFVRQCFSVA